MKLRNMVEAVWLQLVEAVWLQLVEIISKTNPIPNPNPISGSSSFESRGGRNRLTIVGGTSRGSLLLWQLPVGSFGLRGSSYQQSRQRNDEVNCSFDISEDSFSDQVFAPAAFIQLRKGDNARVRRSGYDDDDTSELFPPKVRDVAISPTTGSLGWSHTYSTITSSVLVAAALSDGTIALVCAGDMGEEEEDTSRLSGKGSTRYRAGENRDRVDRSRSRSRGCELSNDCNEAKEAREEISSSRTLSFGQRRSYLETHEGDVHSGIKPLQ
jgi:hypothetical protein